MAKYSVDPTLNVRLQTAAWHAGDFSPEAWCELAHEASVAIRYQHGDIQILRDTLKGLVEAVDTWGDKPRNPFLSEEVRIARETLDNLESAGVKNPEKSGDGDE